MKKIIEKVVKEEKIITSKEIPGATKTTTVTTETVPVVKEVTTTTVEEKPRRKTIAQIIEGK